MNSSDLENVLVCQEAVIETNKRRLSAEEFFTLVPKGSDILEKDEFITGVIVPKEKENTKVIYEKHRERASIDFSIVSVAGKYELNGNKIEHAKIVLGAVAPVPILAHEAEKYLQGKEITDEVAQQAAEYAFSKAEPLPENAFKVKIGKTLVKRSILSVVDSGL